MSTATKLFQRFITSSIHATLKKYTYSLYNRFEIAYICVLKYKELKAALLMGRRSNNITVNKEARNAY